MKKCDRDIHSVTVESRLSHHQPLCFCDTIYLGGTPSEYSSYPKGSDRQFFCLVLPWHIRLREALATITIIRTANNTSA